MSAVAVVAGWSVREALRRRVFLVVLALSAGFLALYFLGANAVFGDVEGFAAGSDAFGVDARTVTGSTILGLAMFGVLFLGVVLAVFLTLGAVRGDAERGLLQPLVVRPLGRPAYLAGRLGAAAAVSGAYVAVMYGACVVITGATGDWWPDAPVAAGLRLVAAIAVISALALLGSVVFASTANGIAVFMLFGAGLTAGLLGQVGDALNSGGLENAARIASWALPFEALYQDALRLLTVDVTGPTQTIVELGPFGGAQDFGAALWPWSLAYVAVVLVLAAVLFGRRDL